MTKQPEALRIADVLIGSPQFSGTPIWQAAEMLRRQHTEITALRKALEQPAVEPVAWIRPSGKAMLDAGGYCTVYASDGMSNHSVPLFAAPQTQQLAPQECKHCTKFFSQYRCNALHGECDCPQCQGLCTCSQKTKVTE